VGLHVIIRSRDGRELSQSIQNLTQHAHRKRVDTYDSTTTTGDSLIVVTMSPFQIMSAEKTIMARFSAWNDSWRLFFHNCFTSATWFVTISILAFLFFKPVSIHRVSGRRRPYSVRKVHTSQLFLLFHSTL